MFLDKMLSVFRGLNGFSLLALSSSNVTRPAEGIGDLSRAGCSPGQGKEGERENAEDT